MSLTAHQLDAYLAHRGAMPFAWQGANCCHFAAGWVAWATGEDPMEGLPATPTARDALRLIERLGGTMASACTLRLGRASIPAAQAHVGDLVLMPTEGPAGGAVGICCGRTAALVSDAGEVVHLPIADASAAWRLRA